MKKVFLFVFALWFAWELYGFLPDLLAIKIRDVKVFDTKCVELDDGLFYPSVTYDGGEELLKKQGYNNPDKCQARFEAIKGDTLPLYRTALGKMTLDPSISYQAYVHLFLLIVATLYVYIRFP